MIRYTYRRSDFDDEVRKIDKKWFDKAKTRTDKFVAQAGYEEESSIWSLIKPVFMDLQKNKCVFCERQFESREYGKIEFDVEHFRPKSSVVGWPNPSAHPKISYTFATGTASASGYYWLAYEPDNYAASCKVCNTTLKSNYFPIGGARGAVAATVTQLASEQPFLCYPLGTTDDDPEKLVTFIATTAVPAVRTGHKNRRGRVIIDFFGLNAREQLHRERARMISVVGPALQAVTAGGASQLSHDVVAKIDAPEVPHAACLRAFKKLWGTDPAIAKRTYEQCLAYAMSLGISEPPTP
jgi:hypothetical protein